MQYPFLQVFELPYICLKIHMKTYASDSLNFLYSQKPQNTCTIQAWERKTLVKYTLLNITALWREKLKLA